jgi:hypothetical protein
LKEKEQREHTYIPSDVPILFLEVDVDDPSEFEDVLEVRGVEVSGRSRTRSGWLGSSERSARSTP